MRAHEKEAALIRRVNPDRIKSNFDLKRLDEVDVHVLNELGNGPEAIRYNVPAWGESYKPRWSIKIWNDPKEAGAEHVVQVGA